MTKRSRSQIAFYSFFLICMAIRYVDGLMLHQLLDNPLHDPRRDPVIWLLQWSGLPDVLSRPMISHMLDSTIILIPIIIIWRSYHGRSIQRLVLSHALLFALYVVIINCFPTLSIRKYLGLALVPVAFIFLRQDRYENYLRLMRYYLCYIFASASMWKVLRGAVWQPDQMRRILKDQHIEHVVHFSDHYITQFIVWMLDHAAITYPLFITGILAQACFMVGFFTKKFDKILTILLILFIAMDYFVMRIEYWEFLVFAPILWYSSSLTSPYSNTQPSMRVA